MDPEGVAESVAHVKGLIDKEIEAGIPPSRIVVGGFSQGERARCGVMLVEGTCFA